MKKNYTAPDMEFVLLEESIVTSSSNETPILADPDDPEAE